jgi:hypothetical protein
LSIKEANDIGSYSDSGLLSFVNEMEAVAASLRSLGFHAITPAREERDYDWPDVKNPELIALKRP